jgi:hypothetical protein
LLAAHAHAISLDEVGHALGSLSVSTGEIEAIFSMLEAAGREVGTREAGGVEAHLKLVVNAARALKAESTARPSVSDIATASGLSRDEVLAALFLLRVMQRS